MVAEVDRSRALVTVAIALCTSAGIAIVSSAPARAAGCSAITEQVRHAQAYGSRLPDCRAYEQVSPVSKNGVDAVGSAGLVQATAAGGAVSFFAVEPFPGILGSANLPSYIGTRSSTGDEWSTEGLEALAPAGGGESVIGVTEDAVKSIVEVRGQNINSSCSDPALVVCASITESNLYLRDNATGAFQLLASQPRLDEAGFVDATPNASRILFESNAKLTPQAESGDNLYEWDETKPLPERVSLAGVLPGGAAPKQGSFAGPGGPAVGRQRPHLQSNWPFYTQNTISDDGSRAFFSDIETGFIYMRELEAKRTIQVSAGKEPAFWRAATRDGAFVFYTEGKELYRFNVNKFEESEEPEVKALAEAREQLTTGAEGVLGMLGISEEDGSYAYFVAPGVLAENENGNQEKAIKGAQNVYEWHNGSKVFIVRQLSESDWFEVTANGNGSEEHGPSGGAKSSRVTPDGKEVLFYSGARLTGYNNNGLNEFYLYSAEKPLSSSNPICVSCDPSETPATGEARLTQTTVDLTGSPSLRNAFLTHNLSSDGRRVFFETEEALVPGDANLNMKDVYEWEADGEGSCESEAQNHGCLYLISTGQSAQESYFGDASADGSNVFFFTRQGLATQDQDSNIDLYDARVEGGIIAQNPPVPPAPCAEEEACRGSSSSASSVFGVPSSATFSGAGNLAPSLVAGVSTRPVTTKRKTAAQVKAGKLAQALKACRSKAKRKRRSCEAAARKRYGSSKRNAKRSNRGGRRS